MLSIFSVVKGFSSTLSLLSRHTSFSTIRSFSTFYNKKHEELKELKQKTEIVQKDVISPALYAFAARMHLNFSDPKILLQAVTHKSFTDTNLPSNERFKELGNCAMQLYITEYFHLKYPLLHTNYLVDIVNIYNGISTLSTFGHEIGLNYVVRWNESAELYTSSTAEESGSRKIKIGYAVARAVQAIVGALYLDKGSNSAQKFVRDHLLSRDFNIEKQYDVKEPKRHLSALMRRLGRKPPISRLLYEAGRLTKEPIFVIGEYSGTEKLAEGFGSSLKMAEFRAAKNALLNHYFEKIRDSDFTLPSTIDTYQKQMCYTPTKVGDTPAKL